MSVLDMSCIYHKDFKESFFTVYGSDSDIPTKQFYCRKGEKNYSRFFYITSGKFVIKEQNKTEITATKGDIIYLPPNCAYVSKWSGANRGYLSINFMFNDYENNPLSFAGSICLIKRDSDGMFFSRFVEMNNIWLKGTVGFKLRCKAKFYDLLYLLAKDALKERHKNIEKGIMYLEAHYLENISIENISNICNISPAGFRRLFKEYSDLPPIQYRNMLRIKKAQELLKSGEYTVQAAAEAVNIPDVYYFSKLFKKMTGENPIKFKKQ